jgi:hypothetical protein
MGKRGIQPKVTDAGRECTKCKAVKPFEEFGLNRKGPFGRQSSCRVCACAESRRRYNADPGSATKRTTRWRKDNTGRFNALWKKSHDGQLENCPERPLARRAMAQAIKRGVLVRQPCEVCGDPKSQGHHWSYAREHWLDVKWLCRKHHAAEHARLRREAKRDF